MKDDIPKAALKLLGSMPVRTHDAILKPHLKTRDENEKIKVSVNGVTYESIRAAKKSLKVGKDTIYKWLKSGKATRG